MGGFAMSARELLPRQMDLLRELVRVHKETNESDFYYRPAYDGNFVVFKTIPGQRQVKVSGLGDLAALQSAGFVLLRYGRDNTLFGGTLQASAIEAMEKSNG
jgi:hypothetical protein